MVTNKTQSGGITQVYRTYMFVNYTVNFFYDIKINLQKITNFFNIYF